MSLKVCALIYNETMNMYVISAGLSYAKLVCNVCSGMLYFEKGKRFSSEPALIASMEHQEAEEVKMDMRHTAAIAAY